MFSNSAIAIHTACILTLRHESLSILTMAVTAAQKGPKLPKQVGHTQKLGAALATLN